MSDIDVIRETINYEELLREGETNHVLKRRTFNKGFTIS